MKRRTLRCSLIFRISEPDLYEFCGKVRGISKPNDLPMTSAAERWNIFSAAGLNNTTRWAIIGDDDGVHHGINDIFNSA